MDGMQLPYRTRCFRSQVLPRPKPAPTPALDPALSLPALELDPLTQPTMPISVADLDDAGLRGRRATPDDLTDSADRMPRVAWKDPWDEPDQSGAGSDTGMLLIDFR